jgi:glycine dehydrogenase subunit 2
VVGAATFAWESAPKGRSVRSFYGNFGILVGRSRTAARVGGPGLEEVTRLAILNANYLRAAHAPLSPGIRPPRCTSVLTDNPPNAPCDTLTSRSVCSTTGSTPDDLFPLVVKGALMIEPTETESKDTLDTFVDAMLAIAKEAAEDPVRVREAPHDTWFGRLDETRAARRPVLRWRPAAQACGEAQEN